MIDKTRLEHFAAPLYERRIGYGESQAPGGLDELAGFARGIDNPVKIDEDILNDKEALERMLQAFIDNALKDE